MWNWVGGLLHSEFWKQVCIDNEHAYSFFVSEPAIPSEQNVALHPMKKAVMFQ